MQSGATPPGASPNASRLGLGCLLLFLVPFFLAGLYIISDGVTSLAHGQPLSKALPVLIFGVAFFSVPMLMLLLVISGAGEALWSAAAKPPLSFRASDLTCSVSRGLNGKRSQTTALQSAASPR